MSRPWNERTARCGTLAWMEADCGMEMEEEKCRLGKQVKLDARTERCVVVQRTVADDIALMAPDGCNPPRVF